MFRFLHTGDLHLDSPFVGLTTEVPAGIASTLRDSTLIAWRRIVDLALEDTRYAMGSEQAVGHPSQGGPKFKRDL